MRRNKNTFWGVMFLVIAAFIIASAMGVFGQIGFWTLVFTPFLIAWFITSIRRLSWGGMLFSLAFAAILYDEMLGIENLTPWPVLLAAMFGSIGLNIIFGKHNRWKIGKWSNMGENRITDKMREKEGRHHAPHFEFEYSSDDHGPATEMFSEMEHYFKSDVCFSEVTKYINCQALRKADIDNSFGTTAIYFYGTILEQGKAAVNVDNSFGHVILYIPKEWRVLVNIDRSFGNCEIYGTCAEASDNVLYVNGETSFGEIEINYI